MKYILITILTISSIAACTNNHHPIRTERMEDNNISMKFEDDGKAMNIKVETKNTENPIDYDKSFDVRNMNNDQKKELKSRILDSLGVKNK